MSESMASIGHAAIGVGADTDGPSPALVPVVTRASSIGDCGPAGDDRAARGCGVAFAQCLYGAKFRGSDGRMQKIGEQIAR